MSNSKILVIELSPEDSARLTLEAKRRQIDPTTLAEKLLQNSLTKMNSVFSSIPQVDPIESLPTFNKKWWNDSVNKEFIKYHPELSFSPDTIRIPNLLLAGANANCSDKKQRPENISKLEFSTFYETLQNTTRGDVLMSASSVYEKISQQDSINRQCREILLNSQVEIEALKRLYKFRGKTEVLGFIEQYPFLLGLLLKAPDQIRHYFPDSQLSIEVIADPEGFDDPMLELAICINLDPDEAVDRLNLFQDNWWLNLSYQIRKPLCLILEYPDDF
jgi:hypothetical protein